MTEPYGIRPIQYDEDRKVLRLLDQRQLPGRETYLELEDVEAVARAIENMTVRGAPAIACAAALGLAAASHRFPDGEAAFREHLARGLDRLAHTRPTAVNLFVALKQIEDAVATTARTAGVGALREVVESTALAHLEADLQACLAMGTHGGELLPDEGGVLTHCNAGALATAGYGTALGVLRNAHARGKKIRIYADETRPVLQGARLTAWELARDGLDVHLICDNMAGSLMAAGEIKAAVVGADRIVRNGDVANKIGTYAVAVLCRYHQIPFYVAAPWTTIDLSLATGREIPIEERSAEEVRMHGTMVMAPASVPVRNPAFDVTPAELVTAIITERGVFHPTALRDADESTGEG